MNNYPGNKNITRAITEAALEILGADETRKVFSSLQSDTPGEDDPLKAYELISRMGNEFAIRYHHKTAQGLLVRIGESTFSILRKALSPISEMGSLENRIRPMGERFEKDTGNLAKILSDLFGRTFKGEKTDEENYCLSILMDDQEAYPDDLSPYFFLGICRAFGTWMDSRKEYWLEVKLASGSEKNSRVCFRIAEFE